MVLGIFEIALRLRDWYVFMWQSVKNFERFQYIIFYSSSLKKESVFQKTGVPFFS